MIKKSTPIQCLQVDLLCDECSEPMHPTTRVLTSLPSRREQFEHECPNGHKQLVPNEKYPHIVHVPAKPDWRAPMVVNET